MAMLNLLYDLLLMARCLARAAALSEAVIDAVLKRK
jgi:hypothetical protein